MSDESRCEVYGVPIGSAASLRLAAISGELRRAGVRVDMAYGGRGVKAGLRGAVSAGATVALLLGDREIDRGTVLVKDLATGAQREVGVADATSAVRHHSRTQVYTLRIDLYKPSPIESMACTRSTSSGTRFAGASWNSSPPASARRASSPPSSAPSTESPSRPCRSI